MDGGLSQFRVEKLSDSNYHVWKEHIQSVLCLKDLDIYIEEDPPGVEGASDVVQARSELAIWRRGDRKAKAIIRLALSDAHIEHTRDIETAKEVWASICNLFERHTLLNKLAARRNFYTATMHQSENVITFINRIKTLASTLKSMNVIIDDSEMAMAVLNGLPDDYDHLISALDALGNEDESFTLEFVKSRILQEEQRMNMRSKASFVKAEAAALLARSRDDESHRTSCVWCSKPGNSPAQCFKLHPELKEKYNSARRRKASNNSAALVGRAASQDSSVTDDPSMCLFTGPSTSQSGPPSSPWILDSGSSSHMTFDRSAFTTYAEVDDVNIVVGTGQQTRVAGSGNVLVTLHNRGKTSVVTLCDVLHVPSLSFQLLSVSKMAEKGIKVQFANSKCFMSRGGRRLVTASLQRSLYVLDGSGSLTSSHAACIANLQLWHERLAHVNRRGIVSMVKRGVVDGVNISDLHDPDTPSVCNGCVYGKGHQAPIPKKSTTRSSAVLELVHTDVAGPISTPSRGGARYFITFIDDYSKWTTVYMMRDKSESFDCFKRFHRQAETRFSKKLRRIDFKHFTNDQRLLKTLRSDNGGEYLSNGFKRYLEEHGVHHQLTVAYTPQQNGVAERMNRTLIDLVRSMLHHKGIDKQFWAEALSTAVYVRNRVTSHVLPPDTTPYHL